MLCVVGVKKFLSRRNAFILYLGFGGWIHSHYSVVIRKLK
jgi:hypothetical protein